jgi:hypothetical protein
VFMPPKIITAGRSPLVIRSLFLESELTKTYLHKLRWDGLGMETPNRLI